MKFQIVCSASAKSQFANFVSNSSTVFCAAFLYSSSTSFLFPLNSGTFPSKYLFVIDTVLFNRLLKSFTKSLLYLFTNSSGVNIPSDDVGICLIK